MKKRTIAIDTPYPKRDAYGALSMPVYNCCAYEFQTAAEKARMDVLPTTIRLSIGLEDTDDVLNDIKQAL